MSESHEILSRPPPAADLTVRYGSQNDQLADVFVPRRSGVASLVMLLHGGFWRAEFDRAHLGPLARALADRGFVVCLPEFRRTGQPGGGWPGTFDDVTRITDVLVGLVVSELGDEHVDPARVVLAGHSAGGHLALWAAGRHHLAASSPWARSGHPAACGVVVLGAICDPVRCSEWGLDGDAVEVLLGGRPDEQPERYARADPMRHVPLGVPIVLLHGQEDDRVPVAMSREYARAARAAGDRVEFTQLTGSGHFGLIDPLSSQWSTVLAAFEGLIAS